MHAARLEAGVVTTGHRSTVARMGLIESRATINLHDLPVGSVAVVDADDPYVARCLRARYLVPTGNPVGEPATPETAAHVEPDVDRAG